MDEHSDEMIPAGDHDAQIAAAVHAAVLPLQQSLEEAKRTIRSLLAHIHGVKSERIEVRLDAEGQLCIDPSWLTGRPAPTPDPAAAPEEKPAPQKRTVTGIAQRHPHLKIEEATAAIPAELQEQVDAGVLNIERTGHYTDSLVVPRSRPFIRREHEVRVVTSATGVPALQIPMCPRIVEGGVLADESIHHLMVAKFLDAIPFFRTLTAWQRQRIDISKQTVNDAATAWCATFAPLAETIIERVLRAQVVFADDGWARTQRTGSCAPGNMWTLVGDGVVGYRFTAGRRHEHAREIIPNDFTGYLMCDGWAGWKTVADSTRGGCNAHARRPFALLADENDDAARMVQLYAALYRVEHDAATGPPEDLFERRRNLRHTQSTPIFDRIEAEAARIATVYPFSHPLAKGARYIAHQRDPLRQFLTNPLLPPDNNAAEGALRINALIRKNSLFYGTEVAGARAAVALTVLHTCRLAGVEPLAWLQRVTPALVLHRRGRTVDLNALIPSA